MKRNILKKVALVLSVTMMTTMMAACQKNTNENSEEVTVKIGYWPKKESTDKYALHEKYLAAMNEKYPNIKIIPDEYEYTVDTFLPAAASGQVPNLFRVPFTEVSKIVDAGFAADLTEQFKKLGYEEALKPTVRELVTVDDKYYGVPYSAYIMGMIYNVELFKQAGLVDDEGRPIYPTNFEELLQTAVTIKEKTGKAGYAFPTIDKQGGWMFMSMAWSFGVDFMEQDANGDWKATFDSPEMINALQYISDMKWKHNVLPENILLSRNDLYQLFATNQVACMYAAGDWANGMISAYGLDKENISNSPVPAGANGACAQIGGDIWMVSSDTTPEQIDAIFKWLEVSGHGLLLDEEVLERKAEKYKIDNEKGFAITDEEFSIFEKAEREEQLKKVRAPYLNVDKKIWNTSYSDNLTLKAEEPVEAQQLYAVISPLIQEILMNENADIPALIKAANENFQKDFLDKN